MGYAVVVAWLIQAIVGTLLLVGWARHARKSGVGSVVTHSTLMVAYLVPWVAFTLTGAIWLAWAAVTVLIVGIPFGDSLMVRRTRRIRGETSFGLRDYGLAVQVLLATRLPPKVTFHAMFSAVVFFGSVGVAIAATVAA